MGGHLSLVDCLRLDSKFLSALECFQLFDQQKKKIILNDRRYRRNTASPGNFTELEGILCTNNEMSNYIGVIGVKLATDSGQKMLKINED